MYIHTYVYVGGRREGRHAVLELVCASIITIIKITVTTIVISAITIVKLLPHAGSRIPIG